MPAKPLALRYRRRLWLSTADRNHLEALSREWHRRLDPHRAAVAECVRITATDLGKLVREFAGPEPKAGLR
jgi:hypothetical protein